MPAGAVKAYDCYGGDQWLLIRSEVCSKGGSSCHGLMAGEGIVMDPGTGELAAVVLLNGCEVKLPSKHIGFYTCVRLVRLSALVRETSVCCE